MMAVSRAQMRKLRRQELWDRSVDAWTRQLLKITHVDHREKQELRLLHFNPQLAADVMLEVNHVEAQFSVEVWAKRLLKIGMADVGNRKKQELKLLHLRPQLAADVITEIRKLEAQRRKLQQCASVRKAKHSAKMQKVRRKGRK